MSWTRTERRAVGNEQVWNTSGTGARVGNAHLIVLSMFQRIVPPKQTHDREKCQWMLVRRRQGGEATPLHPESSVLLVLEVVLSLPAAMPHLNQTQPSIRTFSFGGPTPSSTAISDASKKLPLARTHQPQI
eukprot:2553906-Rhodomonas_salina.2